eukprot:3314517-Lingulodinium_polyedra.AAC.1
MIAPTVLSEASQQIQNGVEDRCVARGHDPDVLKDDDVGHLHLHQPQNVQTYEAPCPVHQVAFGYCPLC